MNKQDTIDALLAIDDTHTKAELAKEKKAVLELMLEEARGEDPEAVAGSKIAEKYRDKYREHGRKAHTATGRTSLNNGDSIAVALEALLPQAVCTVNDLLTESPAGTTLARYLHLNEGMVRMNAGNRIRGLVKRGERTTEQVLGAIKAATVEAKAA